MEELFNHEFSSNLLFYCCVLFFAWCNNKMVIGFLKQFTNFRLIIFLSIVSPLVFLIFAPIVVGFQGQNIVALLIAIIISNFFAVFNMKNKVKNEKTEIIINFVTRRYNNHDKKNQQTKQTKRRKIN